MALFLNLGVTTRAEVIELEIKRVQQQGAYLCWAAVSEMAINHFKVTHPAVTQGQLAAYRLWQKLTPEEIALANRNPRFTAEVESCRVVPTPVCDRRDDALLLGLDYRSSTSRPLNQDQFFSQLKSDKPILLRWSFGDGDASGPAGDHYVSVIGINTDSEQILIWDPWPVEQDAALNRSGHEKWISQTTYEALDLVMGVVITHVSEVFDLEPISSDRVDLRMVSDVEPAMSRRPPLIERRETRASPLRPVGFREALRSSASLSKRSETLKRKPAIRGIPSEISERRVGEPLPIVTLSPRDLSPREIDVAKLLQPVTSAVLYPVIADAQVVDAYLATLGPRGWEERGYASTEVARRINEQRARIGGEANDLYILAVPAWGTFFLAQGFGATAKLTAIATTTFSQAGSTLPASTLLKQMATDLQARERRVPQDSFPVRPPL